MAVTNMFPVGGGTGSGGTNIYGPYSVDGSRSDMYTYTFEIPSTDTTLKPKMVIGYGGDTSYSDILFAKMNDFNDPSSGYTAYRCSLYGSIQYYEQIGGYWSSYSGYSLFSFFMD